MNNTLTITIPYYDAPEMLRTQIDVWQKYPKWVQDYLKVIVVDDGSPRFPAIDVFKEAETLDFPVSLYRIHEDIPWNHGGARNLAFTYIEEGWALLTDIDHVLPPESVSSLLTMILLPDCVYLPARFRMLGPLDWEEIHRHRDSFILTREMFWEVGGFDEDFTGYWNGPSGPFRKALKRKAEFRELDHTWLVLFGRDLIPDANVGSLGRKGSEYDIRRNKEMYRKFTIAHRRGGYSPKNPLRFNWEQVL